MGREKRVTTRKRLVGGNQETVLSIVKDNIDTQAPPAASYAARKGLRLLGIGKRRKLAASALHEINQAADSEELTSSVQAAARETAALAEKTLHTFNEALSTPGLKEETKRALDNLSEYTELALESMDQPIDDALDKLHDAGTKMASNVVQGAVKVGSSALSAIPGVGAVVALGKIANDVAHTAEKVTESVSDAVDAVADAVRTLRMKQREAQQTLENTQASMKAFQEQSYSLPEQQHIQQQGGYGRTQSRNKQRWLLRNKYRTRKVRFAMH